GSIPSGVFIIKISICANHGPCTAWSIYRPTSNKTQKNNIISGVFNFMLYMLCFTCVRQTLESVKVTFNAKFLLSSLFTSIEDLVVCIVSAAVEMRETSDIFGRIRRSMAHCCTVVWMSIDKPKWKNSSAMSIFIEYQIRHIMEMKGTDFILEDTPFFSFVTYMGSYLLNSHIRSFVDSSTGLCWLLPSSRAKGHLQCLALLLALLSSCFPSISAVLKDSFCADSAVEVVTSQVVLNRQLLLVL
ncbi:hypothetical protein L9F63_004863, partial [Diploptera punctata]